MDWLMAVIEFVREDPEGFFEVVWAHLRLSLSALGLAMLIYLPLGVLFTHLRIGPTSVGVVSALRVIPSLALVFLFFSWLGFGYRAALTALVILAAPPLILNTFAGLQNVDRNALEAARGLGMNGAQVFFRVQLPLALPVVIAGIRTASVEILASATLASFVGLETLGRFLLTGISLLDTTYLLAGGIPIMLLVVASELVFGGLQRVLTPPAA